jgi:hypothetical protein
LIKLDNINYWTAQIFGIGELDEIADTSTFTRAIDAVQIHILTRFFRKTTIRIFPIALPSKVDNVELVFNGYKKKYVDKVLREFITR